MTDLLDLMGAKEAAREGMTRAVDHADAVFSGWGDQAFEYLIDYARTHYRFLAEEARGWSELHGLPKPPDGRAWGAVIMRAAKSAIIVRAGFKPAISSRGGPKSFWESSICGDAYRTLEGGAP